MKILITRNHGRSALMGNKILLGKLKKIDTEAYTLYKEIIKVKHLGRRCGANIEAKHLVDAFAWKHSSQQEFYWEKVARKLGEYPTPVFTNPCHKYSHRYT